MCGPSSNDRFIRINEAYNILIDENKKKLYDETLMYHNNKKYPIYRQYTQHQKRYTDNNVFLDRNLLEMYP